MDNNATVDNRPGFMQVTTSTYIAGVDYECGADWFLPPGQSNTTLWLEFGYLDDLANYVYLNRVVVQVKREDLGDVSPWTGDVPWSSASHTYTPSAGDDELGKTIVVTWNNGAHRDLEVDNVTLTPEPASLILLGLGAVGLLRRKK